MADLIPTCSFLPLNFKRFDSPPQLRPWVQCIWSIGTASTSSYQKVEKFYPDAGSSLTIDLTNPEPTFTFVQNKSTSMQLVSANDTCVSIRFNPTGAYFLLGIKPYELSDHRYRLGHDYTPSWLDSLRLTAQHLYGAQLQEQVAYLEQWLLQQLASNSHRESHTWKLIRNIKEHPMPPKALEVHLGLSRRTLERTFKQQLGVSPGQYIGYCRTHQARHLLAYSKRPLADVALECGYYDQPHFSHVFHKNTFETPAEYRKRKMSQIYKA